MRVNTRATRAVLVGMLVVLARPAAETAGSAPDATVPAALLATSQVALMAIVGDANHSVVGLVDQATYALVDEIDLGAGRGGAMVATSNGQRLFVMSNSWVTAVDVPSRSVLTSVAIADGRALALSPDDQTLYTINHAGTVEARNATTLVVERVVATGVAAGGFPRLSVSPDGLDLYVAGPGLQVLSITTGAVVATVSPSGSSVGPVVFLPAGTRAYVAMWAGLNLVAVDVIADSPYYVGFSRT